MAYEVHIDVFDGPFDLLLQLISAQEVDVYEVRLSDIVDAFLAEMRRFDALDLELATEFLLIAATLVELKCRRLLPGVADGEFDDELALFEARDYLLARLVECKMFTGAAAELLALEQSAQQSVARRSGPDERFVDVAPDLLEGVLPERLAELARRALAPRPALTVAVTHVHEDEVSVAETLEVLLDWLPREGRLTFRDLTLHAASTAHVVACFFAILELYKRDLVELEQATTFGELSVCWRASDEDARGFAIVDEYDDVGVERVPMASLPEDWRPEAAAIEAVLTVAIDPVAPGLLAELLEVSTERIEELCSALSESYSADERGFELVRVAGGYRLQSHAAYRGYVERFILDDVPHRMSPAALETLAIVAYKQPISRAQIAAIRGVNVDGVMRALTQRGYVEAIGRDEGPGQAVLFGTSVMFLERLGLDSLDDLPPLERFVPDVSTVELLEHVLRDGAEA